MRKYETYIRATRQRGKIHFTSTEAIAELNVSRNAFDRGMHTLKANGDIISPAKGLYIIVPPEHQLMGSIPAEDLVPILMSHWAVDYYACLLTAALYHEASHQKPQVFQVMTNIQKSPLQLGKIKIEFIYKKALKDLPTVPRTVRTGYLNISSPELTVADMLMYPHHAAGLNNIATVLSELIEHLNPKKLIELAIKIDQRPWLQRLGYILDTVDTIDSVKQNQILDVLKDHLSSHDLNFIALNPELPVREKPRNDLWKIVINTTIESDYDS